MDKLIQIYCDHVLKTIEDRIYEIERNSLKKGYLSEEEKKVLEKYNNLLLEKYVQLDRYIQESEE